MSIAMANENRTWASFFTSLVLLPLLKGAVIGFCALVITIKMFQMLHPASAIQSHRILDNPTRVVMMLYDLDDGSAVGLWQWDSNTGACIASMNYTDSPTGKEVGELLSMAVETGDVQWIARHARSLPTDCGLASGSTQVRVILISSSGLESWVDVLGGLKIENDRMNGAQVWDYLVSGSDVQKGSFKRQRDVWMALGEKTKDVPFQSLEPNSDTTFYWSESPADEIPELLEEIVSHSPQRLNYE